MEQFLKSDLNRFVPILLLCLLFAETNCRIVQESSDPVARVYDLCGPHNGRRIYLEAGRNGIITAANVKLPPLMNHVQSVNSDPEILRHPPSIRHECRIEFVGCPSCAIKWNMLNSTLVEEVVCATDEDHIETTEPPYGFDISGRRICSPSDSGLTKTRNLLIRFVFSKDYEFAFKMEFEVERNQINITGSPTGNELTASPPMENVISTPFFPMFYPRDLEMEYLIQCAVDECQVHVNFIDFHVASISVVEVLDSDGERVEIFTGLSLRPRIFVSHGSSIIIRLNANGGIGTGFRAVVNFIAPDQSSEPKWSPKTDCGGYVEGLGGAITMMNMTEGEEENQFYDCIWIIRPSNKYFHMKTHESLELAIFSNMQSGSQLTIQQGQFSDGVLLANFSELLIGNQKIFSTSITDGFYVHLRGNFSRNSSLALVYTVFDYSECYIGSEFRCSNTKCIPIQLRCDGFDHCGDESDEPMSCKTEWQTQQYDGHWYRFIPNYYFPGTDYSDLRTASILFVTTSAGLVALIACLFIILYRINVRARHQRELQGHLQTISELLDQNNRPHDDPIDEPPIYEAPPDYEEVIKVGMEKEIRRSRRREEHRRRKSKQPILETEPEDPVGTPALTSRHEIVLTEPFPIETAAPTSTAEESEVFAGVQIEQSGAAVSDYQLIAQSDNICIPSIGEELFSASEDMEEEVAETGPTSQGFLIVFQNDEPTAVPIHEFIPFEKASSTCSRCENSLKIGNSENKFANRMVRRFSADPLIQAATPDVDVTRSFRM